MLSWKENLAALEQCLKTGVTDSKTLLMGIRKLERSLPETAEETKVTVDGRIISLDRYEGYERWEYDYLRFGYKRIGKDQTVPFEKMEASEIVLCAKAITKLMPVVQFASIATLKGQLAEWEEQSECNTK